ncbi:hypothetical protein CDAR_570251 [Caerostris darwini]|uniref:Uncharacterized protein n=1 Tax=Caerostris darwini TaxID=1538125 RepID=A0AAV4PDU3_9ARAC|nr:hypothetical protein CDAR_570251 [Caerostris darwini]
MYPPRDHQAECGSRFYYDDPHWSWIRGCLFKTFINWAVKCVRSLHHPRKGEGWTLYSDVCRRQPSSILSATDYFSVPEAPECRLIRVPMNLATGGIGGGEERNGRAMKQNRIFLHQLMWLQFYFCTVKRVTTDPRNLISLESKEVLVITRKYCEVFLLLE